LRNSISTHLILRLGFTIGFAVLAFYTIIERSCSRPA